jgi:hypothetical protein
MAPHPEATGSDPNPKLVGTGVAVALALSVRAQMSLVHAINILHNPTHSERSPGAVWWLDETIREVEAMRKALEMERAA